MTGMDNSDNENNGSRRVHSIAEWANLRAMSQSDVVKHTGIDKSTISRWFNGQTPSMNSLRKLAELFETDVESLLLKPDQFQARRAEMTQIAGTSYAQSSLLRRNKEFRPHTGTKLKSGERSFPLFSGGVGGIHGEYAEAPPFLWTYSESDTSPHTYAALVMGDTMDPRFCDGDMVFANPDLHVRKGDYVIAHVKTGRDIKAADDETEPSQIFIYVKKLIRYTTGELVLAQLNPAEELTFSYSKVRFVHRITFARLRDS